MSGEYDRRGIVNTESRFYHRDPGCSRIGLHGRPGPEYERVERRPPGYRRCFYCHSKAGYRRWPYGSTAGEGRS